MHFPAPLPGQESQLERVRRRRPVRRVSACQSARIASSSSTVARARSGARFVIRWQGFALAWPRSIATLHNFDTSACTRFAWIGLPSAAIWSSTACTSARVMSATARDFHDGRTYLSIRHWSSFQVRLCGFA